ncbi:MAG: methyltransferase domain-containing protein [Gammaproteobacteria bacterium]|nr:methyltransferase domain-containing protein [Gammaproteobacteria bacterium]
MDETQRKEFIRQTFNTVASGYDRPALRFFHDSAAQLVELLELAGDERVLDVATGTGAVALRLARCLDHGHVTGIDMADGMLQQAEVKARAQGLGNIVFQAMDMTALELPVARFDCATAAFALFFVEDMAACLRGIVARLKPGGRMLICGFSGPSFAPNVDLFLERIQDYGVTVPPLSWKRLGDEALNAELFAQACLEGVSVECRDLSYHLPDAEAWWDILWYAGFRGLLDKLPADELRRFRTEHLAEIGKLASAQGIPLQVEILYARGRKPG